MNELEDIDEYFTNQLSGNARARFEENLRTDTDLAKRVAFYMMARQMAQTEIRERRKAEFAQFRPTRQRMWWPYATAAAACLLLVLGLSWYFWRPQPQLVTLADTYIDRNLAALPVSMGGGTDSIKVGIQAFNAGRLTEAGAIFVAIQQRDPGNDTALKFSGIVSLQQKKYDQAITTFHQLGQRTDLFANPGLFYEALARVKRGQPQDVELAKALLQEVVTNRLEGAETAEIWLNH